jgi:hypothetical protein
VENEAFEPRGVSESESECSMELSRIALELLDRVGLVEAEFDSRASASMSSG